MGEKSRKEKKHISSRKTTHKKHFQKTHTQDIWQPLWDGFVYAHDYSTNYLVEQTWNRRGNRPAMLPKDSEIQMLNTLKSLPTVNAQGHKCQRNHSLGQATVAKQDPTDILAAVERFYSLFLATARWLLMWHWHTQRSSMELRHSTGLQAKQVWGFAFAVFLDFGFFLTGWEWHFGAEIIWGTVFILLYLTIQCYLGQFYSNLML